MKRVSTYDVADLEKSIHKFAKYNFIAIVFAFLFMIFILSRPFPVGDANKAKYKAARAYVSDFTTAINMFKDDVGRYPTIEEGLAVLMERPANVPENQWKGPYLKIPPPLDPWALNYRYTLTPQRPHGVDYEIVSAGRDGKFGTADDIENYDLKTPAAYP